MTSRRNALTTLGAGLGLAMLANARRAFGLGGPAAAATPVVGRLREEATMRVHYLEIVTPEVEATCAAYAKQHGVGFSAPQADLGHARTAALGEGGLLGVRAPMHPGEAPVVRPYLLVDDIEAAVATAAAAGAEIAHPPLEIPGRGRFAIYVLGGIQHALWQL